MSTMQELPESGTRGSSASSDGESATRSSKPIGIERPDDTWMRMRTPSPEMPTYSDYKGRTLPPRERLLGYPPVFLQQPYIAYKPVLCFMAMSPTLSDGSTTIGSGTPPSDASEQIWEVESAENDMCEMCLPNQETLVEAVSAEDAPSTGSIGHPHRCELACKYIKKPKGCKDGANCSRCHLCDFRNSKVKKDDSVQPAPAVSAPASRRIGRQWRGTRRCRQQDWS